MVKWLQMQGYEPGLSVEEAKRQYRAKYGQEPEKIIRTKGALLLGPIPDPAPAEPARLAGNVKSNGGGSSQPRLL